MYFKFISSGTKREEKKRRIKKSRRDMYEAVFLTDYFTLQEKASCCVDKYGEREILCVCVY
jgi:hypothetical protein